MTDEQRELLYKFQLADRKVTEIENAGGVWVEGYGRTGTSEAYDEALSKAQALYAELEQQGIYPF